MRTASERVRDELGEEAVALAEKVITPRNPRAPPRLVVAPSSAAPRPEQASSSRAPARSPPRRSPRPPSASCGGFPGVEPPAAPCAARAPRRARPRAPKRRASLDARRARQDAVDDAALAVRRRRGARSRDAGGDVPAGRRVRAVRGSATALGLAAACPSALRAARSATPSDAGPRRICTPPECDDAVPLPPAAVRAAAAAACRRSRCRACRTRRRRALWCPAVAVKVLRPTVPPAGARDAPHCPSPSVPASGRSSLGALVRARAGSRGAAPPSGLPTSRSSGACRSRGASCSERDRRARVNRLAARAPLPAAASG